jgi:hypothetical protein
VNTYSRFLVTIFGGFALAMPVVADAQQATSRQVTVFGIVAVPNSTDLDPKLKSIAPQLQTLFPNHGFKLLGVETKRIATGQSQSCDLGGGYTTSTQLVDPLDTNGKVMLRFQLDEQGELNFASFVTTPLNQLTFADKQLSDGTRLIIGLGVRP